ncbi:MAG: peptidase, partial [Thaumarchaeota archaeon]|nr:peptidase [Nitrososphaerota archaeon]
KSWSTGDIQDSEFVGAIQYLISKGVMHVPHGIQGANSSQPIPTWIKHSTGMWSNGQITDNEFVQSIQWLISKGIIQVGN